MEYLIFKTLAIAVSASILIWYNMKRKEKNLKENKANPQELENGEFGIKKPEDEFLTGVEIEKIVTDPILKTNEAEARPPRPKGTPTIRP